MMMTMMMGTTMMMMTMMTMTMMMMMMMMTMMMMMMMMMMMKMILSVNNHHGAKDHGSRTSAKGKDSFGSNYNAQRLAVFARTEKSFARIAIRNARSLRVAPYVKGTTDGQE